MNVRAAHQPSADGDHSYSEEGIHKALLNELGVERYLSLITDRYKAETERIKAETDKYRADIDADKPLIDAAAKYAELSVRSLLILNGGAAISLLTFAGNKMGSDGLHLMASAVFYLGFAAAGATLVAALSYLAQTFMRETSGRWQSWCGNGFRYLAIFAWAASWITFLCAIIKASKAIPFAA